MECPTCKNKDNKVVDSRNHNNTILRRRECLLCNYRWSTIEINNEQYIKVIKNSDKYELLFKTIKSLEH